jgi:leucyl aminopeptidase
MQSKQSMIEFGAKISTAQKLRSQCLVIGIYEGKKLSPSALMLDKASQGYIQTLLQKGDLDNRLGSSLILYHIPNCPAERVVFISCGNDTELSRRAYREVIRKSAQLLSQLDITEATSFLTELPVRERDMTWKLTQACFLASDILYRFDEYKSKPDKNATRLKHMTFIVKDKRELKDAELGILNGSAIAEGMRLTKNLANTPPNICTPIYLAKAAIQLAKTYPSINTTILDEKDIKALKMGALLAVAQGSINPPRLISLEYRGRKGKHKPIVLVGKGITFDTGGNSLKPPTGMIGMKYDMSGAATVLGVIKAAAELALPLNIVGVIASAENMPGGSAARPDDIVTTMSGQTVEILNTDAEGRLVLCDALTYCERFDPEVVIDMATLTGTVIVALGLQASAVLGNHRPLIQDILEASHTIHDRCWELPLWDEYQEGLSSTTADMANIGPAGEAGTIYGACFLARFAKKFHWAHLDIAGIAARTSKDKMASGRPVPLIVQYLLNRCQKSN